MTRRFVPFPAITLLAILFAGTVHAEFRDYMVNRPANLYERPSAGARIVTRLRLGTVVRAESVDEQWMRVRSTSGRPDGFVRRSYLDDPRSPAAREPDRLEEPVRPRPEPAPDRAPAPRPTRGAPSPTAASPTLAPAPTVTQPTPSWPPGPRGGISTLSWILVGVVVGLVGVIGWLWFRQERGGGTPDDHS